MLIQPVGSITMLTSQAGSKVSAAQGSQGNFAGALAQALQGVNSAVQTADQQGVALAAGTAPSIATVMESATQAQLAIDLTVQVRDRVVQAYNQVMSMQV